VLTYVLGAFWPNRWQIVHQVISLVLAAVLIAGP
jgi:hypothetical protein